MVPAIIYNRPGLGAISYRIGNHALFKRSLMARLTGSGQNILKQLTTRENSDFTIALFDAWSMVADVLTFYQERIANESYLKTATERLSVLEMARLLGYELNPGVAASAYIAFTLEGTPGAITLNQDTESAEILPPIKIAPGTKIQSIPGPGEKAQTFETIEETEARPGWNTLKPRMFQPQNITKDNKLVYLKGTNTGCNVGDVILIRTGKVNSLHKVVEVDTDTTNETTTVKFDKSAEFTIYSEFQWNSLTFDGRIADWDDIKTLDQQVVEDILKKTWDNDDLSVLLDMKNWDQEEFIKSARRFLAEDDYGDNEIYIFRKQAYVFGYNAMKLVTYETGTNKPKKQSEWDEWSNAESKGKIYLDDAYKEVLTGSYIAVQHENVSVDNADIYVLDTAEVQPRSAYGLSAKSTYLKLDSDVQWWPASKKKSEEKLSDIRGTKVYAQSEPLEPVKIPIKDNIGGDSITLDGFYPGLSVGHKVIVHGEVIDPEGIVVNELKEISQIIVDKGYTVIRFLKPLTHQYIREKIAIYANIALATHGETVEEILGGGNPAMKFQKFVLSNNPLTYISASTPGGAESTLEIRVNDILWKETESLYYHGPNDRVYTTHIDDEGKTTVIFGDGVNGSRLPGGQDNVEARYRKGIGLEGNLKKDQLSQLLNKPLGVKSASNPMPATGADDPEKLANARQNTPLSVLTLDRIVSLQDYEDFSRAFSGIEKALATWSWKNNRQCIFITVAGPKGAVIKKDSTVYRNLVKSIKESGNPNTPVFVESYKPRYFMFSAQVKVKPEYEDEEVLARVKELLRTRYSFEERSFGQPVLLSEVISVIHEIRGIEAVDVNSLYISDQKKDLNKILPAAMPEPGDDETKLAELLYLDPRPTNLRLME